MNNNKKKAFILYKYNRFNDDIEFIKEYYNTEEIQKEYNLKNKKSIYNFIVENVEDIKNNKNLLKNKYIIIKDIL